MVKTIFDKKTGQLLGAHMVGAEVTELIQGFVVAMNLETTEEELMHSIFPHPTLSEMMKESVLDAYGRALNAWWPSGARPVSGADSELYRCVNRRRDRWIAQYGILSMPGTGFFGMLVIGFLAGWIAERTMNRDHGILTNILVGIAGSFVGGTLAGLLGITFYGFLGNLVVAIVGAILILWLFGRAKPSTPQV